MSKRKFEENEEDASKSQKLFNSLDSDEEEEDDELKYALKDEDIEGQEDGIATQEEGVQLTPFNMKEELEEGHFDKDGMYHWKKENDARDNWLDNIDWIKIKQTENKEVKNATDSEDEPLENVDITGSYRKILTYLEPKETIAKALKRLGLKRSLSASERLKLKKAGLLEKALAEANNGGNKVTELTELVNSILTLTGNMDIYQETYEHIMNRVSGSSSKQHAKEAVLDMYADDFEDKEKERLNETSSSDTKEEPIKIEPEVMWELKRSSDSNKIEGPFTSLQMDKWARSGDLQEGSLVRKRGTDEFYRASRMDFDLYI